MTTYAKTHHLHPDVIRKVHGYTHRKPGDPWQPADDPIRIKTGFPDGTAMCIECTGDGQSPSRLRAEILDRNGTVLAAVRGGKELMIEWAVCHGDRKYVTSLRPLPVPKDTCTIQKTVDLDEAVILRTKKFLEPECVSDFQGDVTEIVADEEFHDGNRMVIQVHGSSIAGSVVSATLISPDGAELDRSDQHPFLLGTWTAYYQDTGYQLLLRRTIP